MTDIRIKKEASTTTMVAGGTYDYVLVIENVGDQPAYDVEVHDAIPAGLQVVNLASDKGDIVVRDGRVQAYPRVLAAGERATYRISVRVPPDAAAGTVVNTAHVTTSTRDTMPPNNTSSVSVVITRPQTPQSVTAPPSPRLPVTSDMSLPELLSQVAEWSPISWMALVAVLLVLAGIGIHGAWRAGQGADGVRAGTSTLNNDAMGMYRLPPSAPVPPPLLGGPLLPAMPPAPLPPMVPGDYAINIRDAQRKEGV